MTEGTKGHEFGEAFSAPEGSGRLLFPAGFSRSRGALGGRPEADYR